MKVIYSFITLTIVILLSSCESTNNNQSNENVNSVFDDSGVIEQVIQTSNYTYCYLKNGEDEKWVAISRAELNSGETLYYNKGMEMFDFHSKELDRTFPLIYFVQSASTDPSGGNNNSAMPYGDKPVKPTIEKEDYTVEKASDGITIAELYENKEKYNGQKVRIRGKVTKFTPDIMHKNWVHLQDGTDYDGNFDLTITTNENVNKEAIVTFEGIIVLDQDFGYGYTYPVLLQDATVVDEKINL
jgi:hypothetical protein